MISLKLEYVSNHRKGQQVLNEISELFLHLGIPSHSSTCGLKEDSNMNVNFSQMPSEFR